MKYLDLVVCVDNSAVSTLTLGHLYVVQGTSSESDTPRSVMVTNDLGRSSWYSAWRFGQEPPNAEILAATIESLRETLKTAR